ncbi:MAG: Holliday junction resolvase RuvX [Candidatus Dependentiae bacterium]|nr:Holliday junction resolvase RuvX [Candidatus Dependentiae bacterium]
MKILGLDIGDRWIGSAVSDEIGLTTRPYKTVEAKDLLIFLKETLHKEEIKTVVVGYPKTMGGSESDQTKKVVLHVEELKKKMPEIVWVLWDERLTSKHASQLKKTKTKEEKMHSHSIAAAFILKTYLDYLDFQKSLLQDQD